jgi:hypothetical protein
MVDYNFNVPTVQPMQQPNMMQTYAQMQQIQANRMMMEERTRALQEQNALRALLAGGIKVGTPEFTQGAARISPELGLKAETSRLANLKEERTAEAQQAQAENSRIQSMRTLGQIGSDKVAQYRNGLATLDSSDPAAYAAWYNVAAPEFEKVGATLPPPDRWNAQTKGALLQTADSFLASAKEAAPGVQMIDGVPYESTVVNGRVVLKKLQPEGVPSARFGLSSRDLPPPSSTPLNNPELNAMSPYGALPFANALAPQPDMEPLTFEQINARKKEAALAQKGAEERQSLGIKKEFDEAKKQEGRQSVQDTLSGMIEAYKNLGSQGELQRKDMSIPERLRIAGQARLPGDIATAINFEAGSELTTINNLRQSLIPVLTEVMGSKAVDAARESEAILASLTSGGQSPASIARTLTNFSKKYGLNVTFKPEDLAYTPPAAGEKIPRGRQAAPSAAAQPATPAPAAGKPTLQEFLAKAKPANPNASDADLRTYYDRTYGGR